jgi:hypothetical protein
VSWFNSDENIVIVAAYSLLVLGELRELLAVNYDIKLVVYRNLALFTIQNLARRFSDVNELVAVRINYSRFLSISTYSFHSDCQKRITSPFQRILH